MVLTILLTIFFQILYGTEIGFHAIDTETETRYDLYIPKFVQPPIIPHQIVILPDSDGMELLLCYNDEGVYVNTYGHITKVSVFFSPKIANNSYFRKLY